MSVLICVVAAAAQESPSDTGPTTETSAPRQALEELTVIGEKQLGALRADLLDAEDELYTAFNEVVEDSRFRISCEFVAPIGSRIHQRVCQPAYVREAQFQRTQSALDGITGVNEPGILEFSSNAESRIQLLQREMLRLMAETIEGNPDLMRLFLRYRQTQAALEEALNDQ